MTVLKMALASFFAKAHGFIIQGGNFASVGRDQIVNNNQQIFYGKQKREPTEYDQYYQVIQGAICRTKDLGVSKYPRRWDCGKFEPWEDKSQCLRADRTVCTAQVIGAEGRMFTAVSYTGPDAQQALEKDFRMFSGSLSSSSFQVYGVNMQIPTVLFHNVLQPAANFLGGLGFWGQFYLDMLRNQFQCESNEMWLDSQRGVICQGPAGPDCKIPSSWFDSSEMLLIPASTEHLQGDVWFRFLVSQKSKAIDREFVDAFSYRHHGGVSKVEACQLTVFSTRMNVAVAVGGGVWESWDNSLGEGEVMENGGMRFTLKATDRPYNNIKTNQWEERRFWMSQASSIFHALRVSLDNDLEDYKLIVPFLRLKGHLLDSEHLCQTRHEQPIHLFIRRLSPSTPSHSCTTCSLHYWSFDPTGKDPLSAETCNQLGLPIKLSLSVGSPYQFCWDNKSYQRMHEYQLARGFDPTTTDFARHLGYPIYRLNDIEVER